MLYHRILQIGYTIVLVALRFTTLPLLHTREAQRKFSVIYTSLPTTRVQNNNETNKQAEEKEIERN